MQQDLHIKELELVKVREKLIALLEDNSKNLAEIRGKMVKWKI